MTTIGSDNIFNLAIEGNFDECQKIVKEMFADDKFRERINMSGVNSINWARIICQVVYYFYCYFKLSKKQIFRYQQVILVIFMRAILQNKWDYQWEN